MSMAGDAHPADDGSVAPREAAGRVGREGVTVDGNPTRRELTVVLAAVDTARRRPVASEPGESAGGAGGPDGVDTAGVGTDPAGMGTGSTSRERVAHERRCPVCRERYDSRRPLDGTASVRTTGRGVSTVCVDPESRLVYVHSPAPR